MGKLFTLDSLREEVEKEYEPVKIALSKGEEVTLRNLLRVNKTDRTAVLKALKDLEEIQGDDGVGVDEVSQLVEAAETVLVKIAGPQGKKLITELDGDVALIMKVLEHWMGSSQPGEAQNSPDS
jgi:hypothetical protein